jgi:acetyl-CoA carboxylase carboxyltransferase component
VTLTDHDQSVAVIGGRRAQAADRLTPADRLAALYDRGSLQPLRLAPTAAPIAALAGVGRVNGRPVVAYAQDSRLAGGSVGTSEGDVVVGALRYARHHGFPVVGFLESAGARLGEGAAALGAFGRIFFENVALRGRAPQISVITGPSAGGGCYSPALTDFIVMTQASAMFLTGPRVVRDAVGEEITADALGGPRVHERSGVCHFVAEDDAEAVAVVHELLGYLDVRANPTVPPGVRGDPGRHVPAAARQVYDVREVIRDLLDGGRLLEVAPRWARNMVVGYGRLDGRAVGVVANQPRYLGGVVDIGASEKGARFVARCNRFGTPLLVLVDTPGFMPGSSQESAGIIRHGAELVGAFAEATVPRLTVVLRKAYGGAYITMNSKDLGADLALAWSGAEIGIMGARAAVGIVHRRELERDPAPETLAENLAARYAAQHITAERALELGLLDGVIAPAETRGRLADALASAPALARRAGATRAGMSRS